MPKAEIISIGTELLLGEILDSNAQSIARFLKLAGIDLYWMTTVGDNRERIAQAIRGGLKRSDILICTGGLGPTIDDMSREGIADGMGLTLEYHDEIWQEIQDRFQNFGRAATENNRRQAFAPAGAKILDNANGSAPAFLVEDGERVVVSLPGVPREMLPIFEEQVLPFLAKKYPSRSVIKSRILRTAAVGESRIDEKIADLEELSNPTVGMAAHLGAVDIRLTAKADGEIEALEMLDHVEGEIRKRLGDWIFGQDEDDLKGVIVVELRRLGWQLGIFSSGFEGALKELLEGDLISFPIVDEREIPEQAKRWVKAGEGRAAMLATRAEESQKVHFEITLLWGEVEKNFQFRYGGTLADAPQWGSVLAAETLRRQLIQA